MQSSKMCTRFGNFIKKIEWLKFKIKYQSNRNASMHYKYSKDSDFLTTKQRDYYEENGFLVVRNLVDSNLLDECQERFFDIINHKIQCPFIIEMKDYSLKSKGVKGEYLIAKIQDFVHDVVLFKYISYKPIVDIVQSIIGPNITVFHSMLLNKPPNADVDSSRHPLHQDLFYMPLRPPHLTVGVWTAMQKICEKNGCIFVVPGSHKSELYEHGYQTKVKNIGIRGAIGVDSLTTTNLIMDKGDTIFLHPLLLHGSGPNTSQGARRAITSHYIDSFCYTVVDTIQKEIDEDMKFFARRQGFGDVSFEDYFKLKSRLVRGKPGIFETCNKMTQKN